MNYVYLLHPAECALCEKGTYNPDEAQATCLDCAAGTQGGKFKIKCGCFAEYWVYN